MPQLCFSYRPKSGEVIPIENEVIRTIRREAGDDDIVLWKNGTGWVISVTYKDGWQVDAAFCGNGKRPKVTRSTVASVKSFVELARNPGHVAREAKKAEEATRAREQRKARRLQEKQEEYYDLCRYVKKKLRRVGDMRAELPWLQH